MPKEAMNAKDIFYLVQSMASDGTEEAFIPGIPTEGTYSRETDVSSESTKLGNINFPGNVSESFELTLYNVMDDEGINLLDDAFDKGEKVKIWRVNRQKNSSDSHDARFGIGVIESIEETDGSEGGIEFSTTIQINGRTQKDTIASIPQEVLDLLDAVQYPFEQPSFPTQAP